VLFAAAADAILVDVAQDGKVGSGWRQSAMIAGEVKREKHVLSWVVCGFISACEAHTQ